MAKSNKHDFILDDPLVKMREVAVKLRPNYGGHSPAVILAATFDGPTDPATEEWIRHPFLFPSPGPSVDMLAAQDQGADSRTASYPAKNGTLGSRQSKTVELLSARPALKTTR